MSVTSGVMIFIFYLSIKRRKNDEQFPQFLSEMNLAWVLADAELF